MFFFLHLRDQAGGGVFMLDLSLPKYLALIMFGFGLTGLPKEEGSFNK